MNNFFLSGFGSGIGTGLFIGTGSALASAGPLGLLLAYLITGFILWCVMQCIGELAALIPTAGTFPHYANRFVGPSVGFSLGTSSILASKILLPVTDHDTPLNCSHLLLLLLCHLSRI